MSDYDKKWSSIGECMETASKCDNQKEVYQLLNKFLGPNTRKKEADVESFATMIEEKCNDTEKDIPITTVPNFAKFKAPTYDEIKSIISSMKNGKASGKDNIPMEVWKIPDMKWQLVLYMTFGKTKEFQMIGRRS